MAIPALKVFLRFLIMLFLLPFADPRVLRVGVFASFAVLII